MSAVFGLEFIYNQIKRLFIGIKFFFIRIRYILAPGSKWSCATSFKPGISFDFNDNFNVNNDLSNQQYATTYSFINLFK